MIRRLFLLSLLLAGAACASAQPQADRTRARSDRLTHEEIQQTGMWNMFDVIQRLQPGWLAPQYDSGRAVPIGVFMDGGRVGSVEFLRQIPASQIGGARYLTNRQVRAELTYIQHANIGSAIMLSSRRM